jgi:hypothetical protein
VLPTLPPSPFAGAVQVVDTLTDADYVTLVRFSSNAAAYSATLMQATESRVADIKTWIVDNSPRRSGGSNPPSR